MFLEIRKYPNPVLRKKAEEVKEITEEIIKLSHDMKETLLLSGDGLALAANQIGELKRMIAIYSDEESEIYINPKIVWKSGKKQLLEEGCLSFPNLFLKIKRPEEVEVEFLNIQGERKKIKAKGILACAFQHEIDHLNGILFIDRAGFWQRMKFKLFGR